MERINFQDDVSVGLRTLINLHEHHVFSVPFENIDIHFKRKISLKRGDIYAKIVESHRGGFCYELNYIFKELLCEIGFDARIISCRIINDGLPGPEFDHMAVIVSVNKKDYLADVGFGDLFVQPPGLKTNEVQFDGRNFFKIEKGQTPRDFVLSMSEDGSDFRKLYLFNTTGRQIEEFVLSCEDKQINPESYFVRNTICTLPTDRGRMTIMNNRFIETIDEDRAEMPIADDAALKTCLEGKFHISLG